MLCAELHGLHTLRQLQLAKIAYPDIAPRKVKHLMGMETDVPAKAAALTAPLAPQTAAPQQSAARAPPAPLQPPAAAQAAEGRPAVKKVALHQAYASCLPAGIRVRQQEGEGQGRREGVPWRPGVPGAGNQHTALDVTLAYERSKPGVVRALLAAGVPVALTDHSGSTPSASGYATEGQQPPDTGAGARHAPGSPHLVPSAAAVAPTAADKAAGERGLEPTPSWAAPLEAAGFKMVTTSSGEVFFER
ncbi:hypothetical protein QJQ45_030317, partial [Haematococcus lacustris]